MFKIFATFKEIALYVAICLITCCFWIGLEYILDVKVISLHSNSVICFIISWFITDKVYGFLKGDDE